MSELFWLDDREIACWADCIQGELRLLTPSSSSKSSSSCIVGAGVGLGREGSLIAVRAGLQTRALDGYKCLECLGCSHDFPRHWASLDWAQSPPIFPVELWNYFNWTVWSSRRKNKTKKWNKRARKESKDGDGKETNLCFLFWRHYIVEQENYQVDLKKVSALPLIELQEQIK